MTSSLLPLTAHNDPAAVIAHGPSGPVSVAQFIADATRLAELLPAGGRLLNICQDRYKFMVGLAAGLMVGKISLQPPSRTAEMLRQMKAWAPDLLCLSDAPDDDIDLPLLHYPRQREAPAEPLPMPEFAEDQVVSIMFTSGSTGAPMAHPKTWGSMVRGARAESLRLGVGAPGHAIVGTLPPQHMFGFEATILLALHGGCSVWCGQPFYPADIVADLARVPPPRLLVTTPFHLRILLDSGVAAPPLDQVLCSTAPLSSSLAQRAEHYLSAQLHEIYGSTETGLIASRRTAASPLWHLFAGVRLDQQEDQFHAGGGHLAQRTALADVLEIIDNEHFLFHGRTADLINIAGKRSSLTYLNHQLNAIAGVEDGSFLMPDEIGGESVTRLCAFVVAPSLTAPHLLEALRQRIDPIFLPRPLFLVDALPRSSVGKLPRSELQALLDQHARSSP